MVCYAMPKNTAPFFIYLGITSEQQAQIGACRLHYLKHQAYKKCNNETQRYLAAAFDASTRKKERSEKRAN